MGCQICNNKQKIQKAIYLNEISELQTNDPSFQTYPTLQSYQTFQTKSQKEFLQEVTEEDEDPEKFEKSNYTSALFSYLNLARTKPEKFKDLIKKYIDDIQEDPVPYIDLEAKTNGPVQLYKGKKAFIATATLFSQRNGMRPLKYDAELEIECKEDSQVTGLRFITKVINDKVASLKGKYSRYYVNVSIDLLDPELDAVLQVVDDKKGSNRKNNIFSKEITHVGITRFVDSNIVYLIFAR